jgi:hypothetical protein
MDYSRCLRDLISDAEDTVNFFSEARKKERELSCCVALLRSLGVDFLSQEIGRSQDEPPDVIFRSARFEILEIFDEPRRRHEEWRKEAQRRKLAKEIRDLRTPYRPRRRLSYGDLIRRITEQLGLKQYAPPVRATLDALVYVNLTAGYLNPESDLPSLDELIDQGWRSVSLLAPPYAHVLHARHSAPPFLRNLVCQTKREWPRPDGLFEV